MATAFPMPCDNADVDRTGRLRVRPVPSSVHESLVVTPVPVPWEQAFYVLEELNGVR